jgi:quinol monooxygenase YgiN
MHPRGSLATMSRCNQRRFVVTSVGLLARLDAKPGREGDVANFLRSAQALVLAEPSTVAWFAVKLGPSTFGIFDAFPDTAGRDAHLSGRVAAALMEQAAELLSAPPTIEMVDVLADKLPGSR